MSDGYIVTLNSSAFTSCVISSTEATVIYIYIYYIYYKARTNERQLAAHHFRQHRIQTNIRFQTTAPIRKQLSSLNHLFVKTTALAEEEPGPTSITSSLGSTNCKSKGRFAAMTGVTRHFEPNGFTTSLHLNTVFGEAKESGFMPVFSCLGGGSSSSSRRRRRRK